VIEDAPVGIQAARAAGMRSVGVQLYHTAEALAESDLRVTRLADLAVETVLRLARERE
jgi:beta-phosphoglucomutase-like phosphatase (HAD superfamily)